jgi:hypothetical protein
VIRDVDTERRGSDYLGFEIGKITGEYERCSCAKKNQKRRYIFHFIPSRELKVN